MGSQALIEIQEANNQLKTIAIRSMVLEIQLKLSLIVGS